MSSVRRVAVLARNATLGLALVVNPARLWNFVLRVCFFQLVFSISLIGAIRDGSPRGGIAGATSCHVSF